MAGRRRRGRAGKSAYRLTARRKTALRRAQLISARKRKKSAAIKVGILAGGVALGVLGTKYGPNAVNMAKDLKNRNFRFNNPDNSVVGTMTPEANETVMKGNAVSPAAAARQAKPTKPPKMNNTSQPKPNSGNPRRGMGGAKPASGADKAEFSKVSREIDPGKSTKTKPYPYALPNEQQIMTKLKVTDRSAVDQSGLWILSEIWADYDIAAGRTIRGMNKLGQRRFVYRSLLDIFGLETKSAIRQREKEAKKNG